MSYHIFYNLRTNKITVHNTCCGHWKKNVGTRRHKHGNTNCMYIPDDPFGIPNMEMAKSVARELAWRFRINYHQCKFCCPKQTFTFNSKH